MTEIQMIQIHAEIIVFFQFVETMYINQANETCDDGNLNNNDGCSSTCKIERCGDSIKQANEQCDLGILNGNVCTPLYGGSCTYCNGLCQNITLNGAIVEMV